MENNVALDKPTWKKIINFVIEVLKLIATGWLGGTIAS